MLVVCLFIAVFPAYAILGIGDIVFDPTSYAELVEQLLQMEREYTQLVQTYQTIQSQYNQMLFMAQRVPVNMISRYKALKTPWRMSTATNTYGTTGGWISAINSGTNVSGGYASSVQHLLTYGSALTNIPADQVDRIRTTYATVELTDGANIHGMDTLGRLRANAPAVETAIQGLEDDSLSASPAMNTEIAVLNKINAANLISVRTSQDANKVLVTLAEQQIVDAKRKRDAEAQAINDHIRFMSEGRGVMTSQAANASSAMLAWRLP